MSCRSSLGSKQRTCLARFIGRDSLFSPALSRGKHQSGYVVPSVYMEAPPTNRTHTLSQAKVKLLNLPPC